MPRTVWINLGCDWSSSIFRRIRPISTSMERSYPAHRAPRVASRISWRDSGRSGFWTKHLRMSNSPLVISISPCAGVNTRRCTTSIDHRPKRRTETCPRSPGSSRLRESVHSTHDRANAGRDLARVGPSIDHIIGAEFEGDDAVHGMIANVQSNHRTVVVRPEVADAAVAVGTGVRHRQDHALRSRSCVGISARAGIDLDHVELLVSELACQHGPGGRIVIYKRDSNLGTGHWAFLLSGRISDPRLLERITASTAADGP